MKMQKQSAVLDKLCWGLAVVFLLLVCILTNDSYGALVLLGCALLIFGISAVKNRGVMRIHIGGFHWSWGLFGLYCLMTSLWAWDSQAAFSRGITVLELTACTALMYAHFQQEQDMWKLYSILKWAGFLLSVYTVAGYGFNAILQVLATGQHLKVDFANINTISIQAAMTVVICLYEVIYQRKKLGSMLLCIPCIFIIAASGTRKSVLVVLLGVLLLLYFRYQGKKDAKNVLRMMLWVVIALVVIVFVLSLPVFSVLMKRMEGLFALFTGQGKVDGSSAVRNRYIQIGLEQFLKTPIFGIGIDNSGILLEKNMERYTYLHNNFVELLCCGGIVGFFLYYVMHAYCLLHLFLGSRRGDAAAKLGLTLLLVFWMMDIARVSYYAKPTYFYFMIFFLQVRQLRRRTCI